MSFYGTYQRFGVPVWASQLTLLRAAVRTLTKECRRDPVKRAARHAFYRACLEYQLQDQTVCIKYRL
jgi:hypothetical protein